MSTIANLAIKVSADTSAAEHGMAALGGKVGGVGKDMTKVGRAMSLTVTPAALGVAKLGQAAFDQWHGSITALRSGTGATGKALDKLMGTVKSVGGDVNVPLKDIGKTVAELATRLGLTGEPLKQVTLQFARLQRLGMPASVANITRLFGDWSVKTEDQSGMMDKLFRLSQNTGIGLNDLSGFMVQFGSPLRQLGLDFDTTAAMFARFEKEGVNIQTAMPGLRMALKNFAKAGKEPAPALLETINAIKMAKTTAEANTLAFKIFGVRAGPDLAAAIREGRFELDEIINEMNTGKDTIASATGNVETLGDRFGKFKNKVFATIGPYGEMMKLVGGGVAAIGPAVLGIGMMATAMGGLSVASLVTVLTFGAVVLAIIALGVALVILWKKSETFRDIVTGAWNAIKTVTLTVFNAITAFFRRFWPLLLIIATGGIGLLVVMIVKNWTAVKTATLAAWNAIKSFLIAYWPLLLAVATGGLSLIVGAVIAKWGAIKSATTGAWKAVKSAVAGAVDAVKIKVADVFGALAGLVKAAVGAVKAAVGSLVSAFQPIIDILERIMGVAGRAVSALGRVAGAAGKAKSAASGALGKIPGLAHGVRNFGGGLAVVGERGPELVNLPRGSNVFSNSDSREMLGGSASPVQFLGDVYVNDPVDVGILAARVAQRLALR